MAKLVKNLEDEWDILLFDSPPLVAVTDATMISKEIDKIVWKSEKSHKWSKKIKNLEGRQIVWIFYIEDFENFDYFFINNF